MTVYRVYRELQEWLAQLRAENARKIRAMAGAPIRRKNA